MGNDGRRGGRPRGRGATVVLLAGALLASGCGARWSAEERASVFARHGAGHGLPVEVASGPSVAVDPGADDQVDSIGVL